MSPENPPYSGLWLPLVTPFRDGDLDEASLRGLVRHYARQPIDGFILAGTTGEGLTLDEDETQRLVEIAAEELSDAGSRLPLVLGRCGVDTRAMARNLERLGGWPIAGFLIASPYYVRPSALGQRLHFEALADAAALDIILYNIPQRTGVNLPNDELLRLAERSNVVGVKDCCGDPVQSFELMRLRPPGFAVLVGEDAAFHAALAAGADGGITASAHIDTRAFAALIAEVRAGDCDGGRATWREIADIPRLLFSEPSPGPLKHWLWREGLIASPELRLPMTPASAALQQAIDRLRADGLSPEAP